MALERKDVVQDTATSTGTGSFVMAGTPPAGFRAFSVHSNGGTFEYRAFAGSEWEVGTGTWNGSSIARAPITSSNGNALVNFSAAPVVMEVVSASSVGSFLTSADALDAGTLPSATSLNTGDTVLLLRGGVLYTALASLFGSGGASAPVDTTAPTFSSAQVSNATPTVIQITMNESLNTSIVPAASAFAVSGGKTVSSVAISGAVVSLTCSAAYANGDTVTVTYTKPGSGNTLQDAAGNATASFGPSSVTNNVAAAGDVTAPTASSAAVANSTPTVVVVTMSEPMNTSFVPATSAFTVGGHTVSAVAISGSTISLTVDAFVNGEAARTVAYTQPGANNARDLAGNLLANFTGLAITNNVAAASGYTVTGYSGNGPKTTLDMTSATSSGGKKYVGPGVPFTDGSGYFVVKNGGTQVANGTTGVYAGWSQSNAANGYPATTLTGGTPNTGANNVAAFTQMSINATAAQVTAYFWATPGTENGNWYLWFKFPDGSTYCFNPASPMVVSGA